MSPVVEVVLSPSEAAALERWRHGCLTDFDCDSERAVVAGLDRFPPQLRGLICAFGALGGSEGVLCLRGLPVPDDLPPTPSKSDAAGAATGTEPVLLGIALLLGEPISYLSRRGGDRVHNVVPVTADAATQKSSGSVRLEFHTERAFRSEPPDALALFCLRAGDAPPSTLFCDVGQVWERLDADSRALLGEPAFGLPGGGPDGMAEGVARQPVATLCGDELRFQYDAGLRGSTPKHEAVLAGLRAGLGEAAVAVTLVEGDLAIIDNRRIVHGRAPFSPGYQGADRWLQRCLIRIR